MENNQKQYESNEAFYQKMIELNEQYLKAQKLQGDKSKKLNEVTALELLEKYYAYTYDKENDMVMLYDYDAKLYTHNQSVLRRAMRALIGEVSKENTIQAFVNHLGYEDHAYPAKIPNFNYLATKDCLINLDTMERYDYSIDWFITSKISTNYIERDIEDYQLRGQSLLNIIWNFANHNNDRFIGLKQIIYNSITKNKYGNEIIMLIGRGGSGKSALNKLIKSFVGDQYHAALKLSQFNEDKYLSTLRNKVVSIGDDLGDGQYIGDIENLKSLSAHDSVTVDIKHKKGIELTFSGMIIQNAARIPKFSESGEQLKRRLRVYHFQNKFTGVHNKLSNEEFNKMIHNEDVKSYLLNHLLTIDIHEELVGCDELLLEEATSINDDYQSFASSIRYTKLMTLDYIPQSVLKAIYFDYNDYKLRDKNKISSGKLISLMKPHMEKLGYQYNNEVVKRPKACVKDVQILEDIDETMNDSAVQKIFNDNDMQEEAYSFELDDNDYPNYTSVMRKNIPSKCWVKVE